MTYRLLGQGLSLLLMITLGLSACAKGDGQDQGQPGLAAKKKKPPVPVLVAKARIADVPVVLRAVGRVESYQSSPVRTQVGGTLTAIHFREGDFVRVGQVLFEIDPTPFKAALKQLQANRTRDEARSRSAEALVINAETMAKRYEGLAQKGLIPREQYEHLQTNLAAAKATLEVTQAEIEATKASIETAQIQLGYTEIRSPISGQTGSLFAKQGDLIKANDSNPLVTVNQIEPVLVRFSVTEDRLSEILAYRQQNSLRVQVTAPDGGEALEGKLVFVDNAVEPATATIVLKAELPNQALSLWPGQFVDITMTLTTLKSAVVIPAPAVLSGQQGTYVFIIDAEGSAKVRSVTPGIAAGEEMVIKEGLAPDETVVTDGQLRLTPGAKVTVKAGLLPGTEEAKPGPETDSGPGPSDKKAAAAAREKSP